MNADMMLALLQWSLIGVGAVICLGSLAYLFLEGETTTYVYSYPDGRTVEAVPSGGEDRFGEVIGSFMGIGVGLMTMALGAMLFCLRRIGIYMGQMRDELRASRSEGS